MTDGAPDGPDVFLSYAREDEARARELAMALGQRGFAVFWDREVPPGQTWHSYIGEALAKAKCVVVAWSRHSIASQWVLDEASDGKDRNVLVPVLFETVPPPFGFRAIQGADLVDWRPSRPSPAFDSLLSAVRRIVGGQAGSGTDEVLPPVRPPDGQASAWSRWMMPAMVVGLFAVAGGTAFLWWPSQPAPTPPVTEAEPSTPEAGLAADPAAEAEPTGPASAPTEAESSTPSPEPSPPAVVTGAAAPVLSGEPREGMRDCPECPEMVLVPAGEFTMGSPPDEPGREDDEGPPRKVTIAKQFWVGKHEVTFAEWDVCVAGGECQESHDNSWGRDSRPVITISWNDAKAYVFWLSQKTGKTYRLLSEAEWEYAARAGSTTAFWWGQGVGSDNANCNGCGGAWGRRKTAPVGSFKANHFGLYDTAGNVWEWVEDCYHLNYEGAPTDGAPRLDGECTDRVLRGGSWNDEPKVVRSASRSKSNPANNWSSDIGFRVARTAD